MEIMAALGKDFSRIADDGGTGATGAEIDA